MTHEMVLIVIVKLKINCMNIKQDHSGIRAWIDSEEYYELKKQQLNLFTFYELYQVIVVCKISWLVSINVNQIDVSIIGYEQLGNVLRNNKQPKKIGKLMVYFVH